MNATHVQTVNTKYDNAGYTRNAIITVDGYQSVSGTAHVSQSARGFSEDSTLRVPEIGWYGTTTNDLKQARAMQTALSEAVKIFEQWDADTGKLASEILGE